MYLDFPANTLPLRCAMHLRSLLVSALAALLLALPNGFSQPRPEPAPPPRVKVPAPEVAPPPRAKAPPKTELKKYEEVITKEAKTLPGMFAVHRVEDRVYFEIPPGLFDRLMLWQAEVAKGPAGAATNGNELASAVLRWDRRGNKVYLWKAGFAKRASGKAVQSAVEAANMDAIVAAFPVECEGEGHSAVINATSFVLSAVQDLRMLTKTFGFGAGVDDYRSYLSEIKAFPTNIESRSLLTIRGAALLSSDGFNREPPRTITALIHQSLVLLPEYPMRGRFADPRVGYFTESYDSYSDPKTWVTHKEVIARYRLEKKNPGAAASEPVKPIVFYLSHEIPEKWRPYLKKGVEDWNAAFEKAGFKNAVVCKDPPTKAENPDWDPEDARYSVLRWLAEPVQNAMGPHIHDPRSGEVISAHIVFWHDALKMAQLWYFTQCSAQDPRARTLPLPDDLTGELLRYICCHEVGHALGLRHNHRASQAYSVSQLRDPAFTATHGTVASIMSYGRFNYVCQPGDKVKCLIPVIGPYDDFAIEWGYKPIPAVKTAEEERPTLDAWASRQVGEPFLRFGGEDLTALVDPTVLTECIGNDPVEATTCGLKNLNRVMDHLVAATTTKGEDFDLLEEVYHEMLNQRQMWFRAVVKQVGGVVEYRTLGGRGEETFVRVPRDKQKAAVRFLIENAFTTPTRLLDPKVLNRFKFVGVAGDVTRQQRQLLGDLFNPARLSRLVDTELLTPDAAYPVAELVADVQDGIFSELKADAPKIDPLRRALQRAYLDTLKREFEPEGTPARGRPSELRAAARASLGSLQREIADARRKTRDPATAAHLADCYHEIETLLSDAKK